MPSNNLKLVIIGGSLAGLTAATRARRINEKAEITIVESGNYIGIPLPALPEFAAGIIKKKESLITDVDIRIEQIYNIRILKNTKAIEIDREKKIVSVKDNNSGKISQIAYDKLLLACGNKFSIPSIAKNKLANVFTLKTIDDSINIQNFIKKTGAKDVTIVGTNYFGLMTASFFIKSGFNLSIIDNKQDITDDFDKDFNFLIKEELTNNGVKIYLNKDIKDYSKIEKERVSRIKLQDGSSIDTHLIIFLNHITPNYELAKKSGLDLNNANRIKVNEKFQTSDPDIYAVGSIIEQYHIINKKSFSKIPTGAATQLQAKLAGTIIAGGDANNRGIYESRLIVFENMTIGFVGLNSNDAKKYNINTISVALHTGSHERFIPGSKHIYMKILVNSDTKKIIGAQVSGKGDGVDKRLDTLSTAIYSGLTLEDINNLNLCYSPGLSVSKDPINILGAIGLDRFNGYSHAVDFDEVPFNSETLILDVRSKEEYLKSRIENSMCIPLNELRDRLNEIPKEKHIYIFGHIGIMGYIAERILKGNGFTNVFNIEGGILSIKMKEKNY
jgi:NADPH-dependent 2,4-dienoyl-CoA reductase/sulfur reductase-like enzyme/rhodanese-related sulfurtransferase